MPFFYLYFIFLITFSLPAHAEPIPGDSCSAYPNGATMHSGGPELNGQVYVLTCAAGLWTQAIINPDPCAATTPDLGVICKDGTLYAGQSPDGDMPMYTTATDAPLIGYSWNDGSSNANDTSLVNCDVIPYTTTACNTGRASTTFLAAVTGASPAPYKAAQYCENLTANGYGDWYLPSRNELNLLYRLYAAGKGGFASDYYWSSTEYSFNAAWNHNFPLNGQGTNYKSNSYRVRCVRM